MQLIANQLWVVVQEIGKLFWIIIRELGLLLSRLGQWIYAHRREIARHRATPWALIAIAALASGWEMYRYINRPLQPDFQSTTLPVVLISDNEFQQKYQLLTDTSPSPQSSKALTQSIINWIGVPYRDGRDSRTGTDCSGFVRNVYREAYGLTLNRNAAKMYNENTDPIEQEELREGDLVFFDTFGGGISHVGIYLQNGRFAHASTSRGVTIDSLSNPYYVNSYYSSGRVRELSEP